MKYFQFYVPKILNRHLYHAFFCGNCSADSRTKGSPAKSEKKKDILFSKGACLDIVQKTSFWTGLVSFISSTCTQKQTPLMPSQISV